jgi:hypothetical protein
MELVLSNIMIKKLLSNTLRKLELGLYDTLVTTSVKWTPLALIARNICEGILGSVLCCPIHHPSHQKISLPCGCASI